MIVLKWNRTFVSVITGTLYKLCYVRNIHEQSEHLYFKVLLSLRSVKKKKTLLFPLTPPNTLVEFTEALFPSYTWKQIPNGYF